MQSSIRKRFCSIITFIAIILPMTLMVAYAASSSSSFGCIFNGVSRTVRNSASKSNTANYATVNVTSGDFGIGSAQMWVENAAGLDLSYTKSGITNITSFTLKYKSGYMPSQGATVYLSTYATAGTQAFGGTWIP